MRTHTLLIHAKSMVRYIIISLFVGLQVEARLRQLEGKMGGEAAMPRGLPSPQKYDAARQSTGGALLAAPQAYNADADVAMEVNGKKEKKKKKKEVDGEEAANGGAEKKEKKKKRTGEDEADGSEKKKKKKKKDKGDE